MSDLIGKTLGPYRILEQIGVGGMATVYKAYQPSMDRDVAIKILPHYLSQDAEFAKRFQREARAIAKLEHAHILPVYDYGEHDRTTYIAMRYVQAGTLKDRIAKGPVPLDEINRLIGQVGGALDYAHRLGVIHRDVKPGNVLVDAQGDAYLTDFGLARMMEATQQLTASGVGVGTPAYMSPEQGQGIKVDHRSDIYSLGVVLYEMVTGHVPYEAETPMGVVLKHISEPLPLPRKLAPDVPEGVEKVILRALAKDPAHRFQTAGEFVQALAVAVRNVSAAEAQRALEPEKVAEAAPPRREDVSLVTRVQQVWEKPRGKAGLVGGALVVVVVLGFLLSRLPGSVQIVGARATVTTTSAAAGYTATQTSGTAVAVIPSNTPVPTNTPITQGPTATPRPSAIPTPTNTPSPLDQGMRVDACGNDLCIFPHTGGSTPLGLGSAYTSFFGASWSPDGSRIVFAACPMANLTTDKCQELFIADRDGKKVTPLARNPIGLGHSFSAPIWSPGGEWIAYVDDGAMGIIRPDGTGIKRVLPFLTTLGTASIAWSPNSEQIAMLISVRHLDTTVADPPTLVWVINRDGSGGVRTILSSDVPIVSFAWSPDGQYVVVALEDGKAYRIDANCDSKPAGCDASSRTEIDSVPEHWLSNFYPQWAGELPSAEPTPTLSLQAEQARAFAEPILQAIADRKPDFEDDFGTGGQGWTWDDRMADQVQIADGVMKVNGPGGHGIFPPQNLLRSKNFVFEFDTRLDGLGGIGAFFRQQNADVSYDFFLDLDSSNSFWRVGVSSGQWRPLAQGVENMLPVGETNLVMIIARENRFAVYLNDQPIAYLEDTTISEAGNLMPSFRGQSANSLTQGEFDNFKFWNLDNVPGLP